MSKFSKLAGRIGWGTIIQVGKAVVGLIVPKKKKRIMYGPYVGKENKMAKKWYTSKTYGAVATTILSGIFALLSPELQATLAQYVGQILVGVGVIFGILRKVTKQPLN